MTEELQEIAEGLGAKIVGTIPDVGGGAFGAARLARLYQKRKEAQGETSGQPTSERLLEVAVGEGMVRNLERLADWLSKPERHYSVTEVARGLLGFASEYWLEQVRLLQAGEEESGTNSQEATKVREEAERELQSAFREMSGIAGR